MSKAKEFWIEFFKPDQTDRIFFENPTRRPLDYGLKPNAEVVHVREVLPIEWSKIWHEFWKLNGTQMPIDAQFKIKQLVEASMEGKLK